MTLLLLRYSWFKNVKIWLAESIFDYTQLNNWKPLFTFLESVCTCQKTSWLIKFYFRYTWFRNSANWLAERLFDLTKLRNFKSIFILLQFFSTCKKSHWLIMLLRRFKNLKICLGDCIFKHAQIKICKPSLMFPESLSASQNHSYSSSLTCHIVGSRDLWSEWSKHFWYLPYSWFKRSVIWMVKNIFDHTQLKIFKSPFIFLQ